MIPGYVASYIFCLGMQLTQTGVLYPQVFVHTALAQDKAGVRVVKAPPYEPSDMPANDTQLLTEMTEHIGKENICQNTCLNVHIQVIYNKL